MNTAHKSIILSHLNKIIFVFIYAFQPIKAEEFSPFQNYSTEQYQGETQNWCISQSSDNHILIANNKGLLEFNGATWSLYPSPNHTIIRSVNVVGDKIYTGCYMEFGFWQKDAFSKLKYTSLSDKIRNRLLFDEQFWKIINYQRWILFQSLHRIYIYDTRKQTFNILSVNTSLPKMFAVHNKIYFQEMGQGVYQVEKGKPLLLSDFPAFKKSIVINIFSHHENLLIETQDNGFFLYSHGQVSAWQADPRIKPLNVYCSFHMKDGGIALGTIGEGLYILSEDGKITTHLDKKNGLQNNTILSLFEDNNSNLWMGLDNGVSVLNYTSPYKLFYDTEGIFGAIYAAAYHRGYLYIGTNQGLFYKPFPSEGNFKLIPATKGQVWMLKEIDGTLFCGHNSGTFIIENGNAHLVSDKLGTWDIKQIDGNDNLLIQGNYEGLHILEKKDGMWKYRNKIEGFNMSCRYFEFYGSKIFVSHEYNGVFELALTPDLKKVSHWTKVESAPKSYNSGMVKYQNRLLYFCNAGLFEYNLAKKQFQKNQNLTKSMMGDDKYLSGKLIHDGMQSLWAFTEDNLVLLSPGGLGNELQITRFPLALSMRENVSGFENIIHLENKEYLLGTTNGYILIDLDKVYGKEYSVQISAVEKNKLNKESSPLSLTERKCHLASSENNLTFYINVPVYDKLMETAYQYKLEGLDDAWSGWTKDPKVVFKNLPSGEYTFMVRAKVGNKLTSNVAQFHFKIATVWYLTIWMMLVYALLIGLLIFRIKRRYQKRYERHKQKIEREKEKELAMMQLQNEKEIVHLQNEKLSVEVEAKNKELASTTMAIVSKNELLNKIKTELLQEKGNASVKSAIKIIDSDLENNNDWESFQEAFNNIDRNFITRIKELHKTLTPNDLKLCVYLRLNLSSKEIAPLLNISPQSVEIKRFRLRKKMNLDHEQNLTDYILHL